MPLTKCQLTSCQKSFFKSAIYLYLKILNIRVGFVSKNVFCPEIFVIQKLNTSSSSLGSVLGQIFYKGEGDIAVAALIGQGDYDSNRENDEGKNWHNK